MIYSYLLDDNCEHKKAKGVNRNVVAAIINNEYKGEINKISLSCFDDEIFIQNKECDGLALRY